MLATSRDAMKLEKRESKTLTLTWQRHL
jgi:hypothetical protein